MVNYADLTQSLVGVRERQTITVISSVETDSQYYEDVLSTQFSTTFVTSANAALEKINRYDQPNLILLDTSMPNDGDFIFCSKLKEQSFTKDIPILFISNSADSSLKARAFEHGAADFVTKPVDKDELTARIKRHGAIHLKTKMLESLIYIDPMTHLANLSKFSEVIEQEWTRCARYWHHFSLIILQIDQMDEYQKKRGKDSAESLVLKVASTLDDIGTRPGDLLAYLGENRFGMLLSDCGVKGVENKARQLMTQFQSMEFFHMSVEADEDITCTIATAVAAPAGGGTPSQLYQACKDLLFEASLNGRNRIHSHKPLIGIESDLSSLLPK